jgi:beta-glucosidase
VEDCLTTIRDIHSLEKYNRKHTESLGDEEQNDDAQYQKLFPQYEFGTGLSYSIEYSNLTIDKSKLIILTQ